MARLVHPNNAPPTIQELRQAVGRTGHISVRLEGGAPASWAVSVHNTWGEWRNRIPSLGRATAEGMDEALG